MPVKTRPRKGQPARLGGYFASLTVRNVRCFGPEQTLRLLDRRGNPARWTVLLGDNGVGKTTLLQALAIVAPTRTPERLRQQPMVDGLRPELAELIGAMDMPVVLGHVAFELFDEAMVRAGAHIAGDFVLSGELHYKATIDAADKKVSSPSQLFVASDSTMSFCSADSSIEIRQRSEGIRLRLRDLWTR